MEEQKESKMTNTYRLTDKDIRQLIQLRAANAAIFTGRKNSALRGWRAIRQEMGLQGVLSARQLKKKWDNLKEKYKILKNPPVGMDNLTKASSWPWFHMMDEAMSGRLACATAAIQPSPLDEQRGGALSSVLVPGVGAAEAGAPCADRMLGDMVELSEAESAAAEDDVMEAAANRGPAVELYATLLPDCTAEIREVPSSSSSRNLVQEALEVDRKLAELQRERQALEREQAEFDRELICLERDRELLNRDLLVLERDRATVERDRAAVERDRLLLDRDRAFLDRDRAFLERDRVFLERAREDVDRKQATFRSEKPVPEGSPAAEAAEKEAGLHGRFYQSLLDSDQLDSDQLEVRQRLVCLLQRFVEKL